MHGDVDQKVSPPWRRATTANAAAMRARGRVVERNGRGLVALALLQLQMAAVVMDVTPASLTEY